MVSSNTLQVGKIRDDRDLLTGEGQVDEIDNVGIVIADSRTLELCQLLVREAVQPLGQIVQLIQIDPAPLQPLQDGRAILDLLHLAVTVDGISDLQCLQQLQTVAVFLLRDGERDSHHAIFRVYGIAQRHLHHALPSSLSKASMALP